MRNSTPKICKHVSDLKNNRIPLCLKPQTLIPTIEIHATLPHKLLEKILPKNGMDGFFHVKNGMD